MSSTKATPKSNSVTIPVNRSRIEILTKMVYEMKKELEEIKASSNKEEETNEEGNTEQGTNTEQGSTEQGSTDQGSTEQQGGDNTQTQP